MVRLSRRSVLTGAALAAATPLTGWAGQASGVHFNVAEFDRARILRAADQARDAVPLALTQTAAPAARDPHRFFCDAFLDPATADITGFLAHADLLREVSTRTAALTVAWRLTGTAAYLQAAQAQLRVWCVAPATRMNPTLENDAPKTEDEVDLRRNPLRFTLALAELARAASFVCAAAITDPEDAKAIRAWFTELLRWFSDSERSGIARDSPRADSVFWAMQAGELSRFVGNDTVWRDCGHRFRDKLLRQLHLDGNFPYALSSRRPYAESMLLLECLASACESVSTPFESSWNFALADGRGMRAAIAWAAPFLQNRSKWPYPADVRNFSQQPLRENALLFAGRAWNRPDYTDQWKTMTPSDAASNDLRREHPITQPALWTVRPPA